MSCLTMLRVIHLPRGKYQYGTCLFFAMYLIFLNIIGYMHCNNRALDESYDELRVTLKPGIKFIINASGIDHPYTVNASSFLLENRKLCESDKSISVVVMVYSAPTNFERRALMRQTWLNKTYLSDLGTVKVVFLLAKVTNATLQADLEAEHARHADILQGDFIDDYYNLTHKGVMGFQWLSEHCKNAKTVIKSDDDIVINMYRFFTEILPGMLQQPKQVVCYRSPRSEIFRGIYHKSYVPKTQFHGEIQFPMYCKGPFVFLTFDLVPLILQSASITPFFWLEDVYLYGLVMHNIPGISYTQMRKTVDFDLDYATKCFTENPKTCSLFVAGNAGADEIIPVWIMMLQQNQRNFNDSS